MRASIPFAHATTDLNKLSNVCFCWLRKSFIVDKYSLVAVDGNCYVPICMFHLNTCADRSSRETAEQQQQQATVSIQTDTELVYKYTFKPHCVFSSIFLHDVWINSVRALTISSHISTQVVAHALNGGVYSECIHADTDRYRQANEVSRVEWIQTKTTKKNMKWAPHKMNITNEKKKTTTTTTTRYIYKVK